MFVLKKPIIKRQRPGAPIEGFEPRKKKAHGQNFLRKQSVVDSMVKKVAVTAQTPVLEIGPGDGFLTQTILNQSPCARLLAYEIDPDWAFVLKRNISDNRFTVITENVLDVDFDTVLQSNEKWVLLANLPYHVTFPILFKIQRHKDRFSEGVVMVQEEVAQKIVAQHGRSLGTISFLLQHHFEWTLMERIEPTAFVPAPKVFSRLIHFKPRTEVRQIPNEEAFWKFVKASFHSPRQTLRNNLRSFHYDVSRLPEEVLMLRAQQMKIEDFLAIWKMLDVEPVVSE
jgi:16S rRNA (adenine1518-N6/adenine1519-N6)-dimethyltransferase